MDVIQEPDLCPLRPVTRQDNIVESLHGEEIIDPYRWLEDQESPETRAWIDEQIAYTASVLSKYPGRHSVRERLTQLMTADSVTLPRYSNGNYYFGRRKSNEQQYVYYRRCAESGAEDAVIDPETIRDAAPDHTTSISILDISQDGEYIVYAVRQGGADEIEIRIRSTSTLEDLPDVLPTCRYFGANLLPDNRSLYYSVNTEHGPRVRKHLVGTPVSSDEEVFGAGVGVEKIIGIDVSEDRSMMQFDIYYGSSGTRTEVYLMDIASGEQRALINNVEARFATTICGECIYIRTNWDAPNGRLFKANLDVAPNATETWVEVVPTRQDATLTFAAMIGGKLYLNYLENVSSKIVIVAPNGEPLGDLALPGIGSVSGPYGRWDREEAFYSFSSFATPTTLHRLDTATGETTVWARSDVPIESSALEVHQVTFQSKDGTTVPMFLVHARDLVLDGNRPVYMTGYGGFNLSRTPSFSALAAYWAETGGIFALVNLRGGGEFGEEWHQAGMRACKPNTFDDLYAAAEWLIDSGYTSKKKIGVAGRSNGGLLVGAALTQRPDLFGAVLCGYPLLDMIRYHQFLVAGYWVPEYGSSEDPEQFKWLRSYSPYHNMKEGVGYPPTMFVTGDADTRVAPLHARKMAALMQRMTSEETTVLLHYDVKSGHSEGKPIGKIVEDTVDEIVFMMKHLGCPID